MKLYIRAPYKESCLDEIRKMFDEVVYEPWTKTGKRYYEDEMLENLKKYRPDALITELDRITENVLSQYKGLKFIGDCRANPANIDVNACTKHNIPILCTPGRNKQAVAEIVIGLILTFKRNVIPSTQWIKDGKWIEGTTPYYSWMGYEIQGKKVGIVGFGAVGHTIAGILDAFGCDIYFYDPFIKENQGHYKNVDLETLFKTSDIISLHAAVTSETKGMINSNLFNLMKSTALFVNTARSALVDNHALIKVLKERKIAGAILDVLDNEPPTKEDLRVLECPNVLLTPHICGATHEVTDHQSEILNSRIKQWMHNENLEKIIFNKEVI